MHNVFTLCKEVAMQNTARYTAIHERLSQGQRELCPCDYHFYRRYCKQNGIAPLPFAMGSGVAYVPYEDDDQYRRIMARLNMGRSIGTAHYRYLKRYCLKKGLPFPKLESKMTFWLKKGE